MQGKTNRADICGITAVKVLLMNVGNPLICFIFVLDFQVSPVMNELSKRFNVELNASRFMYR